MGRIWAFLLLSLFYGASGLGAQEQAKVKVTVFCDENYKPYSYQENGAATGLYVDVLAAAFSRMPGYSVSIIPVPWKRALDSARRGEVLAIFPPYSKPMERPWLDCAIELHKEELVLFGKESTVSKRKNWPEDYKGLRIGINTGFIVVIPESQRSLFSIDEGTDSKLNIKKLANDYIDGYVNDRFLILSALSEMIKSGEYIENKSSPIVAGPVLSREGAYLAFSNNDNGKYPYKADFKKKLAKIIMEMQAAGEIRKILDVWTAKLK